MSKKTSPKNFKSFEKQAIYIATQSLLNNVVRYRKLIEKTDRIIFVRAIMDQCFGITSGIALLNSIVNPTPNQVKEAFTNLISRFEYIKMTIRTLVNNKVFPENVAIILFTDISNIDENLKTWHKYKSDRANKNLFKDQKDGDTKKEDIIKTNSDDKLSEIEKTILTSMPYVLT